MLRRSPCKRAGPRDCPDYRPAERTPHWSTRNPPCNGNTGPTRLEGKPMPTGGSPRLRDRSTAQRLGTGSYSYTFRRSSCSPRCPAHMRHPWRSTARRMGSCSRFHFRQVPAVQRPVGFEALHGAAASARPSEPASTVEPSGPPSLEAAVSEFEPEHPSTPASTPTSSRYVARSIFMVKAPVRKGSPKIKATRHGT